MLDISGGVCICKNLVDQLNNLEIFQQVRLVLLEKQPSFNPKMRVVEAYLYSYFVTKNFKVRSVSSKIKLNAVECEIPDKISKLKSKYSRNKKIGIIQTKLLLLDQPTEFQEIFERSKKRDDLADSFLMAVTYLNKQI